MGIRNFRRMYKAILKPLFDFLFSAILLLLLAPLIFLIWVILFATMNGKPVFCQKRPGKFGNPFVIRKFRTMNERKDELGNLLPDEERLTTIGKFIRKTSLDELPQLFNVIKGEMSFVGPRPLLMQYLPLYSEYQSQRHDVKPGITGWAQVNGRNAISWEKKFEYDVFYVQKCSFVLDLKILWLTIKKVFVAEGISADGVATMEPFRGTNS